VLYSHDKSFTQWLPVPVTGITVPAGAPYNPLTTNFSGVIFDDLGNPKQFFDSTDAVRANLGLKGDVYQWHWHPPKRGPQKDRHAQVA